MIKHKRSKASLNDPNDNAFYAWQDFRVRLECEFEKRGHSIHLSPRWTEVAQNQFWYGVCQNCGAEIVATAYRAEGTALGDMSCLDRRNIETMLNAEGVIDNV